jgi:hypothetical protein
MSGLRPGVLAALVAACLSAATAPAAEPAKPRGWRDPLRYRDLLGQGVERAGKVEFVEMFTAIVKGSDMGPRDGWFHPSQSRYDWKWLAARSDKDHNQAVTRQEFAGPAELFERLDRNRDGAVRPDDFDWSDRNPYVAQTRTAGQMFRMLDTGSRGRLTREDWEALFDKMAKGKEFISPDDLRDQLFPPPPPGPRPPQEGMPSTLVLLKGLFDGELGSPLEGPRLGERAPPFTLSTPDGKKEISLSDFRGKKPVVLIFGSFT